VLIGFRRELCSAEFGCHRLGNHRSLIAGQPAAPYAVVLAGLSSPTSGHEGKDCLWAIGERSVSQETVGFAAEIGVKERVCGRKRLEAPRLRVACIEQASLERSRSLWRANE